MGLKTLEEFYRDCSAQSLWLPTYPQWTHFRIFMGDRAKKIKNMIYSADHLLFELQRYNPGHVFYTPSKFMDPTKIGRKTSKVSQNLFLFADTFIIDIDREGDLTAAKEDTEHLLEYLQKMGWTQDYVCFSGSKGFHISLPFGFRSKSPDPVQRELDTQKIKTTLVAQLKQDTGIVMDTIVSWDTRRIVRLPGTIHGKTGNLVEIVTPQEVRGYEPKHLVNVEKPEGVGDYI